MAFQERPSVLAGKKHILQSCSAENVLTGIQFRNLVNIGWLVDVTTASGVNAARARGRFIFAITAAKVVPAVIQKHGGPRGSSADAG